MAPGPNRARVVALGVGVAAPGAHRPPMVNRLPPSPLALRRSWFCGVLESEQHGAEFVVRVGADDRVTPLACDAMLLGHEPARDALPAELGTHAAELAEEELRGHR
jgi:hypothetical protein